MSRVVVLGSSFGGLTAAYDLRKKLPKQHEVVLVSNASIFVFRPSLPWVVLGQRTPGQITADFTKGLKQRGIDFLQGTVQCIDPHSQTVQTTNGTVDYDYLLVGLGAHLERNVVPGLDEHSECILWLDDAVRVRKKLDDFEGGRIAVVEVQESLVPCPAYEILFGLDVLLRKRGLRDKTDLYFTTHTDTPFAIGGPKASKYVAGKLDRTGATWYTSAPVKAMSSNEIQLQNGRRIGADLVMAFPPYRGTAAVVQSKNLGDEHGFIPVHRTLQSTDYPNIYGVGDAVAFDGPKSGRMAELHAYIASHNIAAQIAGHPGNKRYKPVFRTKGMDHSKRRGIGPSVSVVR